MNEKKELEEKLNKLKEEYEKLTEKLFSLEKEIEETIDKIYSLDTSMVRIVCPECLGLSYTREENQRKKNVCKLCKGKGWVWAKRWVGI